LVYPGPKARLRNQVDLILKTLERNLRHQAQGRPFVEIDPEEIEDARKRIGFLLKMHRLTPAQAARNVAVLQCALRLDQVAPIEPRPAEVLQSLAGAVAALRGRMLGVGSEGFPSLTPRSNADTDSFHEAIKRFVRAAQAVYQCADPGEDGRLEEAPFLATDWKTNPAYLGFATRATLATIACYLFMRLTSWDGIHTCMITCVVTAMTSLHGQLHKQNLRLAGAIVGAVLGLVAVIFVLPAHQTLWMFLLVLGIGTFLAGWLVAGPLRMAYAGWQIALALNYTILYSAHMTTDLSPIWDRLMGIFVGILAMRAAFVWLAPAPAPVFLDTTQNAVSAQKKRRAIGGHSL
jgi:multidrug resistance protein MdtO